MKLAPKERKLAECIYNMKQIEFTLDDVCEAFESESKNGNFRAAMSVTLRSLQKKLRMEKIRLRRMTEVGRSAKANYCIDRVFFQKFKSF